MVSIVLGLWGGGLVLYDLVFGRTLPYSGHGFVWFHLMRITNVVFLVFLISLGTQLVRLQPRAVGAMLALFIVEVFYLVAIGSVPSASATFGIGNVGLAPQVITAFPIWASGVLVFIRFRAKKIAPR